MDKVKTLFASGPREGSWDVKHPTGQQLEKGI